MTGVIRVTGSIAGAVAALAFPRGATDFVRDVQPILRESCWKCHGFDQQRGGLRLDTRSGAFAGGKNGPVIVPGNGGESVLIERLLTDDVATRMPHKSAPLAPEKIAKLRAWIDEGAAWPDAAADPANHWAWRKPVRPALPAVQDAAWIRGPIDRFVLARLESEGLAPSPEAPPETLLRRVTLDLTGLPPTLAELDAFRADGAYERVVDRLLASPRYGERMAWEWLDCARYADTNGYQEDRTRTMWPWRDWVVDALNRNVPFDQFTIEQLAGDLLPDATTSQRLATGFHRNVPLNGEGGAIAEESRNNYVFDRVDTTATVWLGVTLGCARCHDHKFDPFRQEEYYRLFACFNNIAESGAVDAGGNALPVLALPTAGQSARLAELKSAIAADEARLATAGAPALTLGEWRSSGPHAAASFDAAYDFELAADAADAPDHPWTARPEWGDGKVHALSGENATTFLERKLTAAAATSLTLSFGSDDAIKVWLDGSQLLARKVTRGAAADQELLPIELAAGDHRLRLAIVNGGGPAGFWFEALPREVGDLRMRLAIQRKEQRELEAQIVSVMVMQERDPAREPRRETFILEKGNYERRKEAVEPGLPALLASGQGKVDRLVLARWLVSPEQPLTARVTVNRQWQTFFGTGLVKTAEDFGVQGEAPSHPELLDWLATEFVRSGWDVKALQRAIVTSATYRQSSRVDATRLERDPENRLLARGPRGRLPSFMLRDQALALSGLLVEKIGGPPVKPYQPDGVWEEATFGTIRYERDQGESLYRRSLYTFWRRIVAPTMFFDAAARQVCAVRVARTNTPLQALILLNDVTFVEAARVFAERVLHDGGATPQERIADAFRRATARRPTAAEQAILVAAYERVLAENRADRGAAAQFVAIGATPPDPTLDPAELAAFAAVTSLILNLDEVISKE